VFKFQSLHDKVKHRPDAHGGISSRNSLYFFFLIYFYIYNSSLAYLSLADRARQPPQTGPDSACKSI